MSAAKAEFYIATNGNDAWSGALPEPNAEETDGPFATLQRARDAVRELKKEKKAPITVLIREGAYYLEESLIFEPQDSGTEDQPITYAAYPGETPVLSGGRKIVGQWKPYRDGIMMCELPEVKAGKLDFTQLFVNGKRQIRARYPNYDPDEPRVQGKGYINVKDALPLEVLEKRIADLDLLHPPKARPIGCLFDPETFTDKEWARPQEAVIHIFPSTYWGNLQWEIKEIDRENNILWFGHGGFQIWLPCGIRDNSRFFIENVFEELDAPGEWYLDKQEGVLYYMPPEGVDLATADVVAPVVKNLIEFKGTQYDPVCYINLSGFRIMHTASVFFKLYEGPSRGDWTIHRGGTVFFDGAVRCAVENCFFDAVGGNAVFFNNYNRYNRVVGNKFTEIGESAVCLVGSRHLTYGSVWAFPADNLVSNNLIHNCGAFGKQVAGVYCANAKRTTISHNHIYNMPRAGICFNDGWGGGHIIEFNRIHDTVLETSDHGPFNSWGREWYWCPVQGHGPASHIAGNVKREAHETTVMRYNYFCEAPGRGVGHYGSWGIDLDDGSSNYHIYGNLCLGIGVKCREGDYRTVENNIFINPGNVPAFQQTCENAQNRFLRNITVLSSRYDRPDLGIKYDAENKRPNFSANVPPVGPWLAECDNNLALNDAGEFLVSVSVKAQPGSGGTYNLKGWQAHGFGKNSIHADPMFVDPENGDYRVKPESPALKLGFKNFDMDKFGLLPDFPEKWRD